MLKRLVIILIECLVVAIVVVAGVLLWASWYVDTEEFKAKFLQIVELGTGCPAALRGELNIALYPNISLEILGLDINDHSVEKAPLVSFETIRVSARIMPLLSRQLEFRTIVVDGMQANIIKSKDGKINWQALIKKPEVKQGSEVPIDAGLDDVSLSGLEVSNAIISYLDEIDGDTLTLSGIDIRTGEIRAGESVPFTASSQFDWRDGGIESKIILKGRLESTDGESVRLADANLYASVDGPFLPKGTNPGELSASVVVDGETRVVSLDNLHVRFLGIQAEGTFLSGDLGEDINGEGTLVVKSFSPADIISRYAPDMPVKAVDGLKRSHFKTQFIFDEKELTFKKLTCSLDDLTVEGSASLRNYSDPYFSFDLTGGLVDLDRYLPLFADGEPFYWSDYPLEFFRDFRGEGKAHAKGFKVLNQTLHDISASAVANGKNIIIDAKVKTDASEDLAGKGVFTLGKVSESGVPTFAASLSLNGLSPKSGFALLNFDPLTIEGEGSLTAKLNVKTIECPPEGRSIEILKAINTEFIIVSGKGFGGLDVDSDLHQLDFDKAEWSFNASPLTVDKDLYYGFWIDTSVRGSGSDTFRTFSLSAKGALSTAVDELHISGSGLQVRSSVSGRWYNGKSNRATAQGVVAFDTEKDSMSVKDTMIRAFETTAKGNITFSELSKDFKGRGDIELPGMNIRRLIYLLVGKRLRTQDTEALKSFKMTTSFDLDENGFKLNNLAADLDGLPITGTMSGIGYDLPDVRFNLQAGAFDLDRYLPPSRKPTIEEQRAGKVEKPSPVELPLKFFRALQGTGAVRFDEFKLMKIRTQNLSGTITAEKGKIHVSKVTGDIYEGKLKGDWTGDVGKESLMTRLKLSFHDMQAGQLMTDIAKRDYVRGLTDINLDFIGHGHTDDDIVKTLGGKADLTIDKGSYKFTGYDAKPSAKVRNDSTESVLNNDPRRRRTVFSKAKADFSVKRGKFSVRTFHIDASPVLESHGMGWFDISKNTIDLSIRNDFVAVPSVTVNLKGKLTDPAIHVPKGKILDDTVRNILSLPQKSFNFLRDILPF